MTGSTSDPLVALVYGAMVYPSLRPGVTTTADLIAGQPGPWTLSDPDLAEQAHDIVNRLRTPRAAEPDLDAVVQPLAVALANPIGRLLEACQATRLALGSPDLRLPKLLEHQALDLDDRLAEVIGSGELWLLGNPEPHVDIDTDPEPADGPVTVPEGPAIEWRVDEWMVMIRGAGMTVPKVLKAIRADDDAHGRIRTARLREVTGHPARTRFLLDLLAAGRRTEGGAR